MCCTAGISVWVSIARLFFFFSHVIYWCWSLFLSSYSRTFNYRSSLIQEHSIRDLKICNAPRKQSILYLSFRWAPAANIQSLVFIKSEFITWCIESCTDLQSQNAHVFTLLTHLLAMRCSSALCRRQTLKLIINNIPLLLLPSPWGSCNLLNRAESPWYVLEFSQ